MTGAIESILCDGKQKRLSGTCVAALRLDGAGNNNFDLSAIGPQYQSFDYFETISFAGSELSV
ncbi:hypothetical protein J2X72_004572 [Phyllobacterium sp. 1468]|uniref:hypothetical protein n=1 Tax=Phyllobacterium sp. 1468 TaxID=2817759 RepID=UPI00285D4791|nr:hypothetical protein [Phyllobacterium sp. 1468]MDR6635758.1 hypothetical protein [Phyllobacterium sp. 1468]